MVGHNFKTDLFTLQIESGEIKKKSYKPKSSLSKSVHTCSVPKSSVFYPRREKERTCPDSILSRPAYFNSHSLRQIHH